MRAPRLRINIICAFSAVPPLARTTASSAATHLEHACAVGRPCAQGIATLLDASLAAFFSDTGAARHSHRQKPRLAALRLKHGSAQTDKPKPLRLRATETQLTQMPAEASASASGTVRRLPSHQNPGTPYALCGCNAARLLPRAPARHSPSSALLRRCLAQARALRRWRARHYIERRAGGAPARAWTDVDGGRPAGCLDGALAAGRKGVPASSRRRGKGGDGAVDGR